MGLLLHIPFQLHINMALSSIWTERKWFVIILFKCKNDISDSLKRFPRAYSSLFYRTDKIIYPTRKGVGWCFSFVGDSSRIITNLQLNWLLSCCFLWWSHWRKTSQLLSWLISRLFSSSWRSHDFTSESRVIFSASLWSWSISYSR